MNGLSVACKLANSSVTKKNNQRRFLWQVAALVIGVIAPFVVYAALQADQAVAAVLGFALIVLGMGIIILAG